MKNQSKTKSITFFFFENEYHGEIETETKDEIKISGQFYPRSFISFHKYD